MSVGLTVLAAVVLIPPELLLAGDFRSFLDHHCAECHDGDGSEGDLDLSRFTDEMSVTNDRSVWRRVYEKIESRQMPPPKQDVQPSDEERNLILNWIEEIASRPDQKFGVRDPGKPVLRRLTRLEYNNAIRDLFGLDIDVFMFPERLPLVDKNYFQPRTGRLGEPLKISMREYGSKYPVLCPQLGLPGDNRAEHGYRNRGDAMDFSPLLLEKYLSAAHEIVHSPDLLVRSEIAAELFGIEPRERQALLAAKQSKPIATKGDLTFSAASSFAPKLHLHKTVDGRKEDELRSFRELIQNGFANSIAGVFDAGDASGVSIVPGKGGLVRVPFAGGTKTLTINPNADLWVVGFGTADATSGGKLFCNHAKSQKQFELTFKLEDAGEDESVEQLAVCVLGRKKESGSVKLTARFTDDTETSLVVDVIEGTQGTRFARFVSIPGESIKSLIVDGSQFSGDYVLLDDLGFITNGQRRHSEPPKLVVGPSTSTKSSTPDSTRVEPPPKLPSERDSKTEAPVAKPMSPPRERLRSFIARAFRRPITDEDLAPFLAILDESAAKAMGKTVDASRSRTPAAGVGGSHDSMKAAVVAVLSSPQFLFVEANGAPTDKAVSPLEDSELATRLALFLWASTPDDELLELAKAGRLSDPMVLEAQTRRMLHDPKSRELSESFATQWLRLDQLYMAKPDRDLFKSFYSGPQGKSTMHGAMLTEALLLFETVHVEDRSILDFIAADYTWLNPGLAKHYGLDPASNPSVSGQAPAPTASVANNPDTTRELRTKEDGTGWRRIKLTDSNRGGFVTMAAPLVVTSLPFRTSPVKRGAWLLETVFNRPPTEPKVAFAVANDTKEAAQQMSIRQKFEAHRNQAACYSCHVRLDPPGFALERFNPVGQWRETDGGQAVDAKGEWQGNPFNGPDDFKAILTRNPDEFTRGFIEHLLSYALGRELEIYDMPTVADIQNSARADGWRLSRIVVEIAKSYPFTNTRR
jgi:hypothetical protein